MTLKEHIEAHVKAIADLIGAKVEEEDTALVLRNPDGEQILIVACWEKPGWPPHWRHSSD